MNQKTQLSRFNGGGKTFFFNQYTAANDVDYLVVNAMYGNPARYEKLVLFPQHYIEFLNHLDNAVESLTGFTRPCKCGNTPEPETL